MDIYLSFAWYSQMDPICLFLFLSLMKLGSDLSNT